MEANLIPLHIGPEKQINIFVHGYGAVGSEEEFDELAGRILSAQPAGRVYLMFWKSGYWRFPSWDLAAARWACMRNAAWACVAVAEVVTGIAHFKFFESKAEQLGRRFLGYLSKVPYSRDYPINLIGYSLGARVLHYALAESDWSKYRVRDVILLGGAADADDDDWPDCAEKIEGKIYNAWSRCDGVLKAKPDVRYAVGRHGILWAYPSKIVNRRYEFGHAEYLDNLEYILSRLWPRFSQAKQPLAGDEACPYCGQELWLFGPFADPKIECPQCGLDFEFDGETVFPIENEIECSKCRCVNDLVPDQDYVFYCHDCGAKLWKFRDEFS